MPQPPHLSHPAAIYPARPSPCDKPPARDDPVPPSRTAPLPAAISNLHSRGAGAASTGRAAQFFRQVNEGQASWRHYSSATEWPSTYSSARVAFYEQAGYRSCHLVKNAAQAPRLVHAIGNKESIQNKKGEAKNLAVVCLAFQWVP